LDLEQIIMPSPFPGMDPYLENPEFFPGLHDRMITKISACLQAQLPEHYFSEIRTRVWIECSERGTEPDIDVFRSHDGSGTSEAGGGVAVAEETETQTVAVYVPYEERRESFVEIYSARGGRRLVTAIEVLSPSNKTPGDQSRESYRQKQLEFLSGKVNLVEIDLLRGGKHTTGVPLEPAQRAAGSFDYHVCRHCFFDYKYFYVTPIRLEQRLPRIVIPLLTDAPRVLLDLQPIFDQCYDDGPYRRFAFYQETAPVPPLTPAQAEWANRLLQEKGLIPAAPTNGASSPS
jgi:hypothetical protein